MCFQRDKRFRTKEYLGMIDFDFFKRQIDEAVENNCKFLTMASRGEPILHPKFNKILEYCKDKFFELKINTNATKLTPELIKTILDCGANIVVFSIDAYDKETFEKIRKGGNFDEVLKNIKLFAEIKKSNPKYNKTVTRVSGVFLEDQEYDQNSDKFLSFWKPYVDEVSFVKLRTRWNSYENESINLKDPCILSLERIYIWFDGICSPCDIDYKSYLNIGSVKEHSIKEIWNGERMSKVRELLKEGKRYMFVPCDRCSRV